MFAASETYPLKGKIMKLTRQEQEILDAIQDPQPKVPMFRPYQITRAALTWYGAADYDHCCLSENRLNQGETPRRSMKGYDMAKWNLPDSKEEKDSG